MMRFISCARAWSGTERRVFGISALASEMMRSRVGIAVRAMASMYTNQGIYTTRMGL